AAGGGGQRYAPLRAPGGAAHDDGDHGRHGPPARRVLAIAGGVLAAAIVAVVLVTQVFGGGSDAPQQPNTVGDRPSSSGSSKTPGRPQVDRSQVTVTVVNGTTVQGLARGALNRLDDVGFQDGGVATDTTNQSRTQTIVFYADGQRNAALDVARVLKVPRSRVERFSAEPDGPGIRLLARQDADVVVVLGADKAEQSPTG
ncbi:MAG TPA: LytR C-terminal domain-containing protein, partial [Solirubrobacteraceae bacterium]|nr:LytR C-terminal domain-containing protein [Solirubrobacteraceae bacterium]